MTDFSDGTAAGLDTGSPNVARMYDYWLGGKDNFAADREAAQRVVDISEGRVVRGVRLNRAFLRGAVRAAAEAGVRQFLDLGSGLPTRENVHEAAAAAVPDARTVYVDYDPVVCAHGRALLAGTSNVGFAEADLRRPDEVLGHPAVRDLLDPSEPVALLLVSVLHFVADEDDPHALVARYRDALAPGSRLILSHLASDAFPERMAQAEQVYEGASARLGARPSAEIRRFFDGFALLPPGLTGPREWLGDTDPEGERFAGLVGTGELRG
ncbi:S-adenosyl methyltransferase [Actinomadura meyerae]|uniref:S-adenosyl methyltransferase n=1 Tax=Actinomadura meyerae TaxID=240840 RepID=A0A239EPL1_9ACTN|nr:SAM-dependent methyltransferase [Actinomadura meyerae]SNS46178.1 S-adenosyl methyltransferase [Actinomadura meyerae]